MIAQSDSETAEIQQAFDHPLARSEASATAPLDRISLRDHIVEVEIGAFQVERDLTQRLSFNVVVEVAPVSAPLEDDVDRILSYDKVTEAITTELAAERLNLLETLADNIAARILAEPQARRVFLRIEKLDRGPFKLGVEIVRSAAEVAGAAVAKAVQPRLVYLSRAAQVSEALAGWLDDLAGAAPLVLCLEAPEGNNAVADIRAQLNIDLLQLDQAAWTLMSRDARLNVANTRTELDWAMKQGHISIWAPAKMVLDATTPPETVDGAALTAWFAQEMQAAEVVTIGAELPDLGLPQRHITL
ncbi:dihydroneopterin aldolase [Thalassobius sp. MITS945101]|uniref:dihydroneopterin aldolase n=1 Tax=Thalassobius sp. MITS945101 TaxID=3096994 RepID=UPI003999A6DD